MPSIRDEVSFEKRAAEAHRIRTKYPNRIPVICEKAPRSDLPIIDKKKFLVPMNMLVGEFKYIIHKHINQCAQNSGLPLTHEKTIYLFVENTAPKAGALMQEVYEQHVSDDGFLYVEYSSENTLGCSARTIAARLQGTPARQPMNTTTPASATRAAKKLAAAA